MRTARNFPPTHRGGHPSYPPAYRRSTGYQPKGYHSTPNFGRSPMPKPMHRAYSDMAPYGHDHDEHEHVLEHGQW